MDLEIIIQPLIEKIKQSVLLQREKDKGVELLTEVLENAKQKPRRYELEKLLPPIHTVEDIIDTFTARKMLPGQKRGSINNWVPFKFSKQLHKQYKCLSELNKSHSSADDAEVQSKTSRKVDNYGVLEEESSSDTVPPKKKSLSDPKDTVVPPKKRSATIRAPPTFSEDIQGFPSGNKDVGRDNKDLDEGQHQSWAKTSCHREEGPVPIVLEHLVSKLAQPVLNVRTRQLLILKTNLTSPGIAIFLWSAYNSYHTKQHFKFRFWVHVSRESGEGNILSDILKQVTDIRQEQGWSDQLLRKRLHDFLVFRRYLIVLYGVLRDDVWHNLKSAFPYSLNGSRVILLLFGGVTLTNVSEDWCHQQLEKFSDYLQEESTIFGMKDIMNELSQLIFNPYRLLFLISIVGVAESEKTTLLWAMYNAEDVKQLFQCCAWVHVSEKFEEKDLLAEILKQVTDNEQEELDLEPLRLRLCNFLAQNRYLIVLYDVWSADVWDKLKLSLPNLMNGSRVILTVHEADVAQQTNSWIFGTVCGKDLLCEKVCNPKVKHSWGRLSDIMAKESGIVGLDDQVKELAELVLNSHLLHFLISVVGVAGSGKTALVKAIYNSLAIKQHFDCRAFVSVSQVFEIRKLLADLSMQLGIVQKDESWSIEELQQRLQIYLAWKRYLIVLDDVHTADVWRELSRAFPDPSNGSKVILTTRDVHVARLINPPSRVLQLRLLNDDESWELFVKKVPSVVGNAGLITLKDKILERCGGLPFAIVVLGGLLSTKKLDIHTWSVVIKQAGKRERKKRVTKESSDQPAFSYTKQENEKKKMLHALASQDDKENPIADQPNSLAQHASADTKLEEKDSIGEIEQVGPSKAKPNFSVQQSFSDKKQEVEVKHEATNEDWESSSNRLALSDNKKREEDKTSETKNTCSDQDQSDSSDETLSGILALGYRDLDTDLKLCLNYLGLFPKSYKVPLRRLFQLLVAEGLVKQSTDENTENGQQSESSGSSEERRVKEHVGKLEQRSMIEVEKRNLDGSPKTIRLQSTVYDVLSPRAVKVGFFHIHDGQHTSNTVKCIRRFAEHTEINDDSLQNCSVGLRSYISFKTKMGDLPASGVDKLLKEIVKGGFGLIVILDLEEVYKPVLSKHLSKLPNLKYLGLRWTFLDSIPDSVGHLPCLQTLDVKHTNISTLPGTFWKATNLQHLFMNNICFDTCISKACQTNGSLTNLQTLLGLVIRNKNSVAYLKEAKMHGLRKLGVKCYGESIEEIGGWISELGKLQSLKLRSINKSGQPALKLGDFGHLEKLSQLYLFGKLPEAFDFSRFARKLEILTLSVSELSRDPMEELKMLDNLKILRLHARSYMGETMTCRLGFFPQLRVLKLWMLVKLKEWIVDEGAMSALEEVEIRCCNKLNKPSGLEKLTTLKDLILTSMKENFVKDVKESMSSNVLITVRNWKFSSSWE